MGYKIKKNENQFGFSKKIKKNNMNSADVQPNVNGFKQPSIFTQKARCGMGHLLAKKYTLGTITWA
jgi:hypothetical protein